MSKPDLVQPGHWIAIADRLPSDHEEVIVLIADPSVAIYAVPTCARRDGPWWWSGVPGNWMKLPDKGWTITHWTPLPTWRDGHWMTRGSCLGTDHATPEVSDATL